MIRSFPILIISTYLIASFLFPGCHSFPEEQSTPYFLLKIDTATTQKGIIQEGDSLLFTGSLASRVSRNTIYLGVYRSPEQPFDFAGPDSDFVYYNEKQTEGKILGSVNIRTLVPSGIRPGNYICFGLAQEMAGQKSDSVKRTLFISNTRYPEMVLDTPFNGLTANHRIDSANWVTSQKEFRFQIRSFADRMERIELQWFDSLKSSSIDSIIIQNISSISGVARLNRLLSFPDRKGRKFYLRTKAVTLDNRSLNSWIPFERNFAFP